MVIAIPNTGSTITMGKVNHAYTNATPTSGSNIRLRATLGANIGIGSGPITLSSSFGGRIGPFDYS